MESLIQNLKNDLKNRATEHNGIASVRYFKESVMLYGVKSAQVKAIAKQYYDSHIKRLDKTQLLKLCKQLWQSGYLEETFVAFHRTEKLAKQFSPENFLNLEEWVKNTLTTGLRAIPFVTIPLATCLCCIRN